MLATTTLAAVPRLAAPGLSALNVSDREINYFSEHLAQRVAIRGLSVITRNDIQALVGMERQKELLGCSTENSASCMAELGNALGVDGVITGSIARFEDAFQLNIKVISARDGKVMALYSAEADGPKDLLGALDAAAAHIATQLGVTKATPVANSANEIATGRTIRTPSVVAGAAGGALLVGGAVLFALSLNSAARLDAAAQADAPPSFDAAEVRNRGVLLEGSGYAALGVGAAAVITAVLLHAFDTAAPANVSIFAAPSGAAVVFEVPLP